MLHHEKNEWRNATHPYEKPSTKRSLWQITNTLVPFFFFWYLAYQSLSISYFLTLGCSLIAGGMLVRLFIIFHDCCHGAFFKSRKANDIIGTVMGVITCVPYQQWKHSHSVHHGTSGNLDKRGMGDIWTVTIEEYLLFSKWKQIAYRLYRHPLVMFGIGPSFIFLIDYRFNRKGAQLKERINTYLTNAFIWSLTGCMGWWLGWGEFFLVQTPVFLFSETAGIWLFYVQHQFENGYYEKNDQWDYVKAALQGSSFYRLPKVLQWFTGNIGFHHIHHLSPRIPNYYLETVHEKSSLFQKTPVITFLTSFKSLQFHLWDEEQKKFMSFKEIPFYLERKKAS